MFDRKVFDEAQKEFLSHLLYTRGHRKLTCYAYNSDLGLWADWLQEAGKDWQRMRAVDVELGGDPGSKTECATDPFEEGLIRCQEDWCYALMVHGTPTGPYNVSRLHACIPNLPERIAGDQVQIKYYDEGVGTNAYDRIRGGMFGAGLAKNIRQAYAWLIRNYQEGSELFIFGFSRGAYTARSLAGLIARCGIARRLPNPDADKLAEKAYTIYRSSPKDNTDAEEFRNKKAQTVRIQFLGVWDTVGALGVPSVQFAEKFHDTKLGANVDNAYHAVAIDEHRKAYDVVLWTGNPGNANMEQRWFPGAHANIGGGYEDDLLPDLSLKWMLEKACGCGLYLGERNGIALKPDDVLPLDQSEFRSPVRDSYQELAGGIYSVLTLGQRHYRKIGNHLGERVDASAFRKWEEDPGYRPYNLAHAEPGVLIPAMGAAVATANVSGSHPMADESRETPP